MLGLIILVPSILNKGDNDLLLSSNAVVVTIKDEDLKRKATKMKNDSKTSLVEMSLDDVGELCAGRHQECTNTTDWETECPFYDSEEKKCILQRRPFAWTTRINEMENLEKIYKNMK